MKLWIDADATPRDVKELVYRLAERLKIPTVLVANSNLTVPLSQFLSTVRVGKGLDVADQYIAREAGKGDVAVTADVPLAAALVKKGITCIDVRGELYTEENAAERLAMRDLMTELRESGVQTGGPRPWDAKDKVRFANALDRVVTQALKATPLPK